MSPRSHPRHSPPPFALRPGRMLAGKYEVMSFLGAGWEGEVYKICERDTGIVRAAKLFYPQRNVKNRTSTFYAKKLHKLRDCSILIQYHTQETLVLRGAQVVALISEYVDGELLLPYVERQRRSALPVFQGIHLLHSLAVGIESIHSLGEYHGDLHAENIIVRRLGLSFDLKVLDLFHRGRATREHRNDDLCDLIRVFYDATGGAKRYRNHPPEVKSVCCGLKRSLILKKFRNVSDLRLHLESLAWS